MCVFQTEEQPGLCIEICKSPSHLEHFQGYACFKAPCGPSGTPRDIKDKGRPLCYTVEAFALQVPSIVKQKAPLNSFLSNVLSDMAMSSLWEQVLKQASPHTSGGNGAA